MGEVVVILFLWWLQKSVRSWSGTDSLHIEVTRCRLF